MSYEAYNALATAVKAEIQSLNQEEKLGILKIVVNAMDSTNSEVKTMTREEAIQAFNDLSGCIKTSQPIDWRQEYFEYLDEKYGV